MHLCRWMHGCDSLIARMCQSVNGPAMEALAKATGYTDTSCIDFFRYGAPLMGKLPQTTNGREEKYSEPVAVEDLMRSTRALNKKLVHTLKEEQHSAVLWDQVLFTSVII